MTNTRDADCADTTKAYAAFKKVTDSLANHKSILKIFPSSNNYASVVCGGLHCLLTVSAAYISSLV